MRNSQTGDYKMLPALDQDAPPGDPAEPEEILNLPSRFAGIH